MGVGIIELVDGKKQYNEYAGGGNSDAKSEYVYIERFVKTETLISEWKLGEYETNRISAKMYNAITGEYLKKESGSDRYIVEYVPLYFGLIPYGEIIRDIYPVNEYIVDAAFFACLGIAVGLHRGIFEFANQKKLSEHPLLAWHRYSRLGDGSTLNSLKEEYPAFLFRGYMKKLETNDPMYIKFGTKTLDDAENYIY